MGLVGGRGTSRRAVKDMKKTAWAGDSYREYIKKQKENTKNAFVTMGRGTKTIKMGDLSESKKVSARGRFVSMGRGTGRRRL